MAVKYPITLNVSEPNNNIGLLKIRQADEETQTLVVQILEDATPKSYEGLQVFFCAKIGQTDGLGIIEQKLLPSEMTDPKIGKLEYTMRAQDWQILGRQLAYFSFRKMVDDHTFVQQFTTRDFTYEVTKNVFSDGSRQIISDGSTYIWTIEDLKRLYEEYIASGKSDWEEFVEQNKEVLESVDPGGTILSELIRSRKPEGATQPYPDLPTRLDEQIGKNNEFRGFESSVSFMQRVQNENAERSVNVKWFGAKGDNITDDTAALQEAFDYGFANRLKVFIPAGDYVITKPLLVKANQKKDISWVSISGAGMGITNIHKKGKTTYSFADETTSANASENIDAVIILMNESNYDKIPIQDVASSSNYCSNIKLEDFSIFGDTSDNTEQGIFALGISMSEFKRLLFKNLNVAMQTIRYNMYCTYSRLEIEKAKNGFRFLSPFWGNTTMNFSDIHLNGVDEVGYDIKGKATLTNCSSDGGMLLPLKFTSTNPTIPTTAFINSCHFESPVASGVVSLSNSKVTMTQCEIEIPMQSNAVTFKAKDGSVLNVVDSRLERGNRSEFPEKSAGKMYETDVSSRIMYNNLFYKGNLYANEQPYYDPTKNIIFDRFDKAKKVYGYIAYIESSILDSNYPTYSIDKSGLVTLNTTGGKENNQIGSVGFVIDDKVDLSKFSMLELDADIIFNGGNGDSNAYTCRVNLLTNKPSEGFVSKGTVYPSAYSSQPIFYGGKNRKIYLDVSNVFGSYYLEIRCGGQVNVKINSFSLLI